MHRNIRSLCGAAIAFFIVFPVSLQAQKTSDGWRAEWNKTVAMAKKEAKLAMFGPRGAERREALTEIFSKRYGIEVEYFAAGGFEVPPRVQRERQAGLYLWDIFMTGTTTLLKGLKPLGALDPIEHALILPEVREVKNWRGGELPFFDKTRSGLSVLRGSTQAFAVNTKLVKTEEIKSWRDLLNSKWKGKIIVGRDPRTPGYGKATFLFLYADKNLGPAYIRELVKQDLKLLHDDRIAAQWVAQGKVSICLCAELDVNRLMEEGLPIRGVEGRELKEGTYATSAFANVALANRAPHPNAAKLYVNWLLTPEAGLLFSKTGGLPSMRLDVPTDHKPESIPEPWWAVNDKEEGVEAAEPLDALLKELLGAL